MRGKKEFWNLRAVIWFKFPVSSHVFMPSLLANGPDSFSQKLLLHMAVVGDSCRWCVQLIPSCIYFCINIDRTIKWSMQMEIFAHSAVSKNPFTKLGCICTTSYWRVTFCARLQVSNGWSFLKCYWKNRCILACRAVYCRKGQSIVCHLFLGCDRLTWLCLIVHVFRPAASFIQFPFKWPDHPWYGVFDFGGGVQGSDLGQMHRTWL